MDQQAHTSPPQPPTVLIVDDQPTFCDLVRLILAKGNAFQVVGEAHDAATCASLVERLQPGVVLLDIELPGGNGIDLCGEMHRRYPGLAIVIMSAHTEDVYRDEALRLGAPDFIRKHELSAARLKQALARPVEG